MLRRSSKYRDVKLNALITSSWLSLDKESFRQIFKINQRQDLSLCFIFRSMSHKYHILCIKMDLTGT